MRGVRMKVARRAAQRTVAIVSRPRPEIGRPISRDRTNSARIEPLRRPRCKQTGRAPDERGPSKTALGRARDVTYARGLAAPNRAVALKRFVRAFPADKSRRPVPPQSRSKARGPPPFWARQDDWGCTGKKEKTISLLGQGSRSPVESHRHRLHHRFHFLAKVGILGKTPNNPCCGVGDLWDG